MSEYFPRASGRSTILHLFVALLALTATSCHKKPAAPATSWACERRAETNGLRVRLRLNLTNATPGAVLICELDVQSPAATHLETPQLNLAGTELVDFTALSVSLNETGDEQRQFRWTFQAGPPGPTNNVPLQLRCISGEVTNSLAIELPAIVIRSAFAPGTFTNALPPLEEHDAL